MVPSLPAPAAPAAEEPAPAGPPAGVAAEQPPPEDPPRPRRTPWVVLSVAGAAVVLTLGWWAGNQEGIALLMSYRAFEDQPWRLFTSTLLHLNVVHLAVNLYWLWILGRPVEDRWGPVPALGVILLLAAGSAAAEYAHTEGGVGLSGVDYGLFGMVWVLGRSDPYFRRMLTQRDINLFLVWLLLCVAATEAGTWRIGNYAHGAGLVLGVVLAMAARASGASRRAWAALECVLLAATVLAATAGRAAINRSPERGIDLVWDGYQALEANDNERAATLFERAIRLNPAEPDRWMYLSWALQRLGRWEDAVTAAEKAITVNPGNADRRSTLANSLQGVAVIRLEAGRPAEAVSLMERAVQLDPKHANCWYTLGFAFNELGRTKEAFAAFKKALELDPHNSQYREAVESLKQPSP